MSEKFDMDARDYDELSMKARGWLEKTLAARAYVEAAQWASIYVACKLIIMEETEAEEDAEKATHNE